MAYGFEWKKLSLLLRYFIENINWTNYFTNQLENNELRTIIIIIITIEFNWVSL